MNKKNCFVLCVLMLIFFFLSASVVCAGDNVTTMECVLNTDIDNSFNDTLLDSSGDCDVLVLDECGSFKDLNSLIKGTDAGAVLVLDKDYVYDNSSDFNFNEGLLISRSILIDGQGHIIDGQSQSRIFEITGDNVILKNVSFKNAYANLYAGAIIWQGDYGLINYCTFDHSEMKDSLDGSNALAAAILWRGSNGIINNTLFKNGYNQYSADSDGCAGVVVYGINDKVENCVFINNSGYISALNFGTAANNCMVNNCTVRDSSSLHAIFFSRRSQIPFTNCNFIDNNITNGGSNDAFIWVRGSTVVSGCYFENNRLRNTHLIQAGTDLINCTFNNNVMLTAHSLINLDSSASCIEGCKFYNHQYSANAAFITTSSGLLVRNCDFENNTLRYIMQVNGVDLVSIVDCNFTSNVVSNVALIIVQGNSNRTNISNCNFISCSGFTNAPVRVNCNNNYGYIYAKGNVFDSVTNSSGTTKGIYIMKGSDAGFSVINEVYVSPSGNGSGLTKDSRTTLDKALRMVDSRGTIFLEGGNYQISRASSWIDITYNIVGENNKVVIDFNGGYGFHLTNKGLTIENITFNNVLRIYTDLSNQHIINCTFKNCKYNGYFVAQSNSYGGRNNEFNGITMENCSFQGFSSVSNIEANTFKNFLIKNSTFTSNFIACGSYTSNVYENFLIVNTSMKRFIDHSGNFMGKAFQYDYIHNITVLNSLVGYFIVGKEIDYWNLANKVDGVNIINCSGVEPGLFCLKYEYSLFNVNVINYTPCSSYLDSDENSIVRVDNMGNSIINLTVSNLNASFLNVYHVVHGKYGVLHNNEDTSCSYDNIILNNVIVHYGFSVVDNSILNKLNFTNCNFTMGIGDFNNGVSVENSYFADYNGHFIVNGSNVKFIDCVFSNGNFMGNGSAVELVNGDNFIIRDCSFIDNLAYRGAVYINNVTESSYIIDCVFSGNNASDTSVNVGGGAIFIEPGIHYYVNPKTRESLNTVLKMNDLYDYDTLRFVDDVWVVFEDGSEWDSSIVDEKGDYNHPVSFSYGYSIVSPYGIIHFKVPGGVFPYVDSWVLEDTKPGIVFEGNNCVLSKVKLVISDVAVSSVVKNLIFENVSDDSVIVWEAIDGEIVNCSFRDNDIDGVMYGGALRVNAFNLTVVNSSFINNILYHDDGCYGAAVYCNGSDFSLINCYFCDNSVGGYGSHVYLDEGSFNIFIDNSTFRGGRYTTFVGSGVYVLSSDHVTFSNCIFLDNYGRDGAGILIGSIISNLVVINSNFSDNSAINGGAIGLLPDSINEFKFYNNTFCDNRALQNGGAVYTFASGLFNIKDSFFFNNSALFGSAIYCGDNVIIDVNDSFFACPMYNETNNKVDGYIHGNFVKFNNISLSFTDLNHVVSSVNGDLDFEFNYKYFGGYDVSFKSGVVIDKPLKINGHSFVLDGGYSARILQLSADGIELCNISFVNARSVGDGGAIYAGCLFVLDDCIFVNNSALRGSAIYYGGVLDLDVDSCVFVCPKFDEENNKLAGYIYSACDVDFSKVTLSFTDLNHSICTCEGILDLMFDYRFFKVYDDSFIGGVIVYDDLIVGGMGHVLDGSCSARIFDVTSNVEFVNVTFVNGNGSFGGAIYSLGNVSLVDCVFLNNFAVDGGALYLSNGSSNIVNSIFVNNIAFNGSAIYVLTSTNEWCNVEFVDNIANGNAIVYFKEDSILYSDNLSFVGNVVPNGLDIVGESHIYAPVIYVNMTHSGFGIIDNEPTSIEHAVNNILSNGNIILLSDYTLDDSVEIKNSKNITIKNFKNSKIQCEDKFLFVLLTMFIFFM